MKLLRSLYTLVLPQTSKELQSVEQEVRWRLRRLKYKHLVYLAESCASFMQQQQHSQELLAELLIHLERRWTEINDSRTVVTMMLKTGHHSESLMNRLEDKVCMGLRTDPLGLWAYCVGDSLLQKGKFGALEASQVLYGKSVLY